MIKTLKILLFLLALFGLLFAVCVLSVFYPLPYIYETVEYFRRGLFLTDYVFAGYLAFVCLCFFALMLLVLVLPDKSNVLAIKRKNGSLQFSKSAIVSTIRYSFSQTGGIGLSKIKVRLHRRPEKTRVYIKLSLNEYKELAPFTETIQEKIIEAIQTSLGFTPKTVTVKVVELKTGESLAGAEKSVVSVEEPYDESVT